MSRSSPDSDMRAVQFGEHGGNEVLRVVDVPQPEPGPDQVLIKNAVAGESAAQLIEHVGVGPAGRRGLGLAGPVGGHPHTGPRGPRRRAEGLAEHPPRPVLGHRQAEHPGDRRADVGRVAKPIHGPTEPT